MFHLSLVTIKKFKHLHIITKLLDILLCKKNVPTIKNIAPFSYRPMQIVFQI